MFRTRIMTAVLALFFTTTTFAADPALPALFKQAKDKFMNGDYRGSLADFDTLDTKSAQPGNEADRAKLLPVISFYRGANLAALGRKEEAKEAFITYLGFMPTAAIASPPYPKATVALFDQARKEATGRSTTLNTKFAAFGVPADWALAADEHWIETPVRFLLTAAQKKEYAALSSASDRQSFIDRFWSELDPTPGTPANEFRTEFERRLAFIDTNYSTEGKPGRYSDRASVFVFLGTPTYAAQANVAAGEDAIAALRSGGNSDMNRAMDGGGRGGATITGSHVNDNLENESTRGVRESWYYKDARIPQGVPYKEVRFDFVTKQGYGTGVMQKDPAPLDALGKAVENARTAKRLP